MSSQEGRVRLGGLVGQGLFPWGSDPSMELGQKIRGDPPAAFRQRQSAGHFGSHTSVFVNPASQKLVV